MSIFPRMNVRNYLLILFILLWGCSETDIEPCSKVEIGMSEVELVNKLGKPFQKSDDIESKKAFMFKGKNIPTIMVVELEKHDKENFLVTHCNVM